MVLRWFKDSTDLRILARDAGVSIATAYRYIHERIDVVADHGPDLNDVLSEGPAQGVDVRGSGRHLDRLSPVRSAL